MTQSNHERRPTHIRLADGSLLLIDYSGANRELYPPRYRTSMGTFVAVDTADLRRGQNIPEYEIVPEARYLLAEAQNAPRHAPVFGLLVRG